MIFPLKPPFIMDFPLPCMVTKGIWVLKPMIHTIQQRTTPFGIFWTWRGLQILLFSIILSKTHGQSVSCIPSFRTNPCWLENWWTTFKCKKHVCEILWEFYPVETSSRSLASHSPARLRSAAGCGSLCQKPWCWAFGPQLLGVAGLLWFLCRTCHLKPQRKILWLGGSLLDSSLYPPAIILLQENESCWECQQEVQPSYAAEPQVALTLFDC